VFVEIVIREDGVTASTPPLPAPPGQGPANANHTRPKNGTAWNAGTDTRPGERNLPATMNVPAPPATKPVGNSGTPGAPAYVPGVADSTFEKNSLPLINIPGPPSKPAYVPPDPLRPPGLPPADARLDTGPARVPSCVLVGKRLESLALKDSRGQVWDYRKQGYGKLVLIDFWGTYCLHCREAMPILDRLHTLYGTRGLEVIGIALESGKDERRETEAVQRFASSMKLHYRQLIGRVGAFDAGKNFKVDSVPTLILLGENGDIIWHHVGRPDTALLNALERTIQTQLNNRAY
jgi:thiol-disulfide isomerase/thioredoxin